MSRWDEYASTLGTVVSVDSDAGLAMVEVSGAEVPAWMPDHTWLGTVGGPAVAPGVTVRLARVLGGYEVQSAYSGATGGGGPTLGPELLANGGFETGPEGAADGWASVWSDFFTTPLPHSITNDTPVEGSRHLRVTTDPGYDHNATYYRATAARIDPGLTYRFGGFVRGATVAGSVAVSLEIITGTTDAEAAYFAAGTVQVAATAVDPGGAWASLAGEITVPAGHTYVRASVRTVASVGTEAVVDVDALSLRQRLA